MENLATTNSFSEGLTELLSPLNDHFFQILWPQIIGHFETSSLLALRPVCQQFSFWVTKEFKVRNTVEISERYKKWLSEKKEKDARWFSNFDLANEITSCPGKQRSFPMQEVFEEDWIQPDDSDCWFEWSVSGSYDYSYIHAARSYIHLDRIDIEESLGGISGYFQNPNPEQIQITVSPSKDILISLFIFKSKSGKSVYEYEFGVTGKWEKSWRLYDWAVREGGMGKDRKVTFGKRTWR